MNSTKTALKIDLSQIKSVGDDDRNEQVIVTAIRKQGKFTDQEFEYILNLTSSYGIQCLKSSQSNI